MNRRWAAAVRRSRAEPNTFARELFDGLPARYDALEELLSFGQNRRWRAAMVDAVADAGPRAVLDVATGTAGVALAVARRTGAEVTGVDLTEQMLRRGRARVLQQREPRVRLALARAEQLPFADASFDALTFTYLLRYVADPAATLAELARVVRPGGVVAGLEFGLPRGVWRPLWEAWVRVGLPTAGRLISPAWHDAGRILGPSIRGFHSDWPPSRLEPAWRNAGMEDVRTERLSVGGGLVMWARRSA